MQQKRTEGQAIASMVLGILSIISFGILTAIPAVICGHIAKNKIRTDSENLQGDGMALSGLILGYITIGISILVIPFILLAIGIPAFTQARESAMESSCRNNLRSIEYAKEACAAERSLSDGTPVTENQIGVYLKGGMESIICADQGEYTIRPIGLPAGCSVHGTVDEPFQ